MARLESEKSRFVRPVADDDGTGCGQGVGLAWREFERLAPGGVLLAADRVVECLGARILDLNGRGSCLAGLKDGGQKETANKQEISFIASSLITCR